MHRFGTGIRALTAVLVIALVALMGTQPALAAKTEEYNKNYPQILAESHLDAEAAVLMDGLTGQVLFSKNANVRMYPASTTKIMTLMLALESNIAMDMPVIIPQQASQIPSDSTLVPVFPRDQMTWQDLLYGFMLSSGNDGANAVAVLVAGSLDGFVARMNERAQALGCTGTHFSNAHGYHANDHYTTAYDMALITKAALESPEFRRIVSTQNYTMTIRRDGETITTRKVNTNVMINSQSSYYYKDCIGVKTGTHSRAGNCFVGASERDGVRLVSVALKCSQGIGRWVDTTRLFNYGYTCYTAYTLEQMFSYASDQIATVKVSNAISSDPEGGELDLNIAQISNAEYKRMVATDNEQAMADAVNDFVSRSRMTINHDMVAPISEGEIMGNFRYVAQSGEEITALLIAARSVEAEPPKASITDFFPFLKNLEDPLVRALILVLICLVLLIILAGIIRRATKQRRRRKIYEVRRLEKMRADREKERMRREAKRRRRSARRGQRARRKDAYDEYDEYDRDEYDDYDDYDEYDDF